MSDLGPVAYTGRDTRRRVEAVEHRSDDGTTNPNKYIKAYVMQENLFTDDNFILCRVFSSSSKGLALTWWHQLSPGLLIHSTYLSSVSVDNTPHVNHIRVVGVQRLYEQPHKYRSSNTRICLCIYAKYAHTFGCILCKKRPSSMDELRHHVAGFIQMEELLEFSDFMSNLTSIDLRTPEFAYAYMQSMPIPLVASFHQTIVGSSSTNQPNINDFV
ncbi:hypothetical protein JHK85_006946 [Glycine max]|nr:hypothetical protein JHK85_006946 [Glycine max]